MQIRTLWFISTLLAMFALSACTTQPARAPVIDRLPSPTGKAPTTSPKPIPPVKAAKVPDWRPATYTVQKGDTLYSIALEHGQDYKELAAWNNIPPPYTIQIGQILKMQAPVSAEGTTPLKSAALPEAKPLAPGEALLKKEPKAVKLPYSEQALAQLNQEVSKPPVSPPQAVAVAPKPEVASKPEAAKPVPKASSEEPKSTGNDEDENIDWAWPANGKILANFNDNGSAKGVDIGGSLGQPVAAAAAGKVVHTGSTLRGYGKLIIIKHNKNYFSVYAHNNEVLVREGQKVVKGQRVAEMGSSDADRVKLHFEIRHLGKPVDPLKYLPNDKTS